MKQEGIFQKIFGFSFGWGSNTRIPLRSNVFGRGKSGYSVIGSGQSKVFDNDRESPLLGNAQPTRRISGYLERVQELKSYQLLDISTMCMNFFSDYINNFLNTDATELVTIIDENGETDQPKTDRINTVLSKDIRLFSLIQDNLADIIFFGNVGFLLDSSTKDKFGHTKFKVMDLLDPVSVIIKRTFDPETGDTEEEFIAKGSDGVPYVIPSTEAFYLGSPNLRLQNDLSDEDKRKRGQGRGWMPGPQESKKEPVPGTHQNRDKVVQRESYYGGTPIFYTNILKVKELVVKELLISLLSLRDLLSPSLLALQLDKGISLEDSQNLVSRVQKLLNNHNELSSFLSSSFDVVSIIENTLTSSAKVIPDFNGAITNKNLVSTDKLTDKLLELMQSLDQTRQAVLSPLGITSMMSEGQMTKWQVLQSSERSNSRVFQLVAGIKESVSRLVQSIYKVLYDETIDDSQIKLHIMETTTVEFNNKLNSLESCSNMVQGVVGVIQNAVQTLDAAAPLVDPQAFVNYIKNMLKSVDGDTDIITDESTAAYIDLLQKKLQAQMEQMGIG